MGAFLNDLRYGLRTLSKNPGFSMVALLSLALGIGANTAIFQLLDAVRLRTLPVNNPQEIADIYLQDTTGIRGSKQSWFQVLTNPQWERIRDSGIDAFQGLFAWAEDDFNTAPTGEVRHAQGLWVSGDFFRVLGIQPVLGRVFAAADDRRGCGMLGAVVSYSFWQRELGADRNAVGRKLTLNYTPVDVIGVTPQGFTGLDIGQSFDVALPLCSQAALNGDDNLLDKGAVWWLSVMGRLKPGWTLQRAIAELGSLSPGIFEATLPKNYPRENIKDYLRFKLAAYPASTGVSYLRDQYADPLWLLLGTAGLVLLIACANLASLLLARATAREKEIGVRLALGASRSRLVGQLMSESLLLAAAGAALGLLVARVLSQFLVTFLSTQDNKLFLDLRPDVRVLGFTAGVAIVTCLFFGLAPALRATRVAPESVLRTGGRGLTNSRERFGLRRALVCAQVALSVVLLVCAILFSLSLHNVVTADTGFHQRGVLITWVDMTRLRLPVPRRIPFKHELLDRLRAIPGVQAASDVDVLPLSGSGTDNLVWREGSDSDHGIDANFNSVSREYFSSLQVPLLAGRDFNDTDGPAMRPVAIVNQAFARRLGLGANPVGQTFVRQSTPFDPQKGFEIVGLVGDTKYRDIHRGFLPIAYLSSSQDPRPDPSDQILIRSRVPMAALVPVVRQAIAEIDPGITSDFESFGDAIDYDSMRERLMATISVFFGALAGLLAVIGLYGVISYMVVQRTNEIGIRMTLGAGGREVLVMILREAGMVLLVGLGSGLLLSLAGGSAARSLLFGLQPYDPRTLGAAALLLSVVALAASYLPARRAARLDPMEALRYE